METCISHVKNLMIENKLQTNDQKTECRHIRPNKFTQNFNCTSIPFRHSVISFYTTAKYLGFHFADDMQIDANVQDICRKVYIGIQRISSICHLLSIASTKNLICAFVLPKLDYCNYLSIVAQCICWKDFRRFKLQQQE